jgi:magnesium transporter
MAGATWTDLLDPTADELRAAVGHELDEAELKMLVQQRRRHGDEPRPTFHGHGDHIFGVFLVPVSVPDEDLVFYQEVDVVAKHDAIVTIRKTPPGREPFSPDEVREAALPGDSGGMILYRLLDTIAERYLDLVDDLDAEIDEVEEEVDVVPSDRVRERLSKLRHDLLEVRRTLTPMRDAVRRVVDDLVEVEVGERVFPRKVEIAFNHVYDKLLRAADGLELTRDLLAGVRDYHQSKVANDQNEVVKRLTAIASLLLVPTFIVGLYGQNFDVFPELHWSWGYGWSWGLIVASTVFQLWYFRRKDWL